MKSAFKLFGWTAALLGTYLAGTAVAALRYRPRRSQSTPQTRVTVLIPAHNEQGLISRCVESLRSQDYPEPLRTIAVIADNCTDRTAELARAAGADLVLERSDPDARGKGQALRWALDQLLGSPSSPDAVVIVDADSVVAPGCLAALVAEFEAGAEAVQGDYTLKSTGSAGSELRATAFILVNRVRQAGRAAMGQSALLVGNGMLFSSDLLRRQPWRAFTSTEDLEYTIDLQLAAIRIAFAGDALVTSETAPDAAAAAVQQGRWEGGRLYLARTRGAGILATSLSTRRPGLLVLLIELGMPPLGLLAGGVIAGGTVSLVANALGSESWTTTPWRIAGGTLPIYVLVGLRAGRAPKSSYRALAGAPKLILRKPLALWRAARFNPQSWVRTARADERQAP